MKKPLPKVYEHPFSKNTPISPDEGGFFEWVSRLIRLYDTQENCDVFKWKIKSILESSAIFEENSKTCAEEFERRLAVEKKYNELRRLVFNLFDAYGGSEEVDKKEYQHYFEKLGEWDTENNKDLTKYHKYNKENNVAQETIA